MTTLACLILLAAGAAMSGAYWYAQIAARHARHAAACLRDVKKAIARLAKASGIAVKTDDLEGSP